VRRGSAQNAALALASFAVTWLLLELIVLPLVLPLLPLRIHAGLPRALRPLAQSSKAGTLPDHYVALLGDSYAQGAGDWLLGVDPLGNPPFHSAHLLHERTGRDVISFGASGAGSLRAIGTEPGAFVDYLQRTWRFRLAEPELLLVYFYEGNDLQDNLRDLDHTFFGRGYDPARIWDGAYFRDFVKQTAAKRTPLAEELETWHWTDNLFLARFVARIVKALVSAAWPQALPSRDWSPGTVNRARIGGGEVALPDALQGPPLELTPEQLELALWAHAQGLALLRERFGGVRTLVVYVPSPLAIYPLVSPEVDVEVLRPDLQVERVRYPAGRVTETGDRLCRRIEAITLGSGAEFLDALPKLQGAAAEEAIHGPRDWKHLNRLGQERLVDAVVAALEGGGEGSCAARAQLHGR
jgi:hypothetical protein